MKNRILYLLLIASAALASCDKINENLTRLPKDELNLENYFVNESECQLWLNYCYTQYFTNPETTSAYWTDVSINTKPFSLVEGTRLVTSANTGEKAWGWSTMRRIHIFLEHAGQCKDEAVRTKYTAVARFFRALGYFEKVMRFGDVPYYDHVVSSTSAADLRKPRDPRGYVMLKIMEDLDYAIENLPADKDVAHVTRWTALALKSRAALFEGTWRVYHADDVFAPKNDPTEFNGQPVSLSAEYFLKLAVDASEKLIDSGMYTIYSKGAQPYRDLFKSDDAKDEEVILAQIFDNSTSELKNMGHDLPYQFTNKNFGMTKRFVNMYLNADGTRFTDTPGYEKAWYLDEVKGRDPRLSQTIMCPGYKVDGQDSYTIDDFSTTLTGYKPIKWASTPEQAIQDKGECDLAIFRYAEVLLDYAEAKAELGTLTQSDLDKSVNRIRARVGMPSLKTDVTLDSYMASCYPNYVRTRGGQEALLLEVRREMVIELALEQTHLWDMLRWGEGGQLTDNAFPHLCNGTSGYYGVYIPGPGLYDMDGDGTNDFEIYVDQKTSGAEIKHAVKMSTLKLTDPDDPFSIAPTKGYITGYKNVAYYDLWNESRDYLYPVPQPQINLTIDPATGESTLTQNPGWETKNEQ